MIEADASNLNLIYTLFFYLSVSFHTEDILSKSLEIGEVSLQIIPTLRDGCGSGNWFTITLEFNVSNLLAISGIRVTPSPAETI